MKQLVIPIAIIILSCTFFSCEKEVVDQQPTITLAKSVAFHAIRIDAGGSFDAAALDTLSRYNNFF